MRHEILTELHLKPCVHRLISSSIDAQHTGHQTLDLVLRRYRTLRLTDKVACRNQHTHVCLVVDDELEIRYRQLVAVLLQQRLKLICVQRPLVRILPLCIDRIYEIDVLIVDKTSEI